MYAILASFLILLFTLFVICLIGGAIWVFCKMFYPKPPYQELYDEQP